MGRPDSVDRHESLRREMDRLFERFIEPRWNALETTSDWWPRWTSPSGEKRLEKEEKEEKDEPPTFALVPVAGLGGCLESHGCRSTSSRCG